VELDLGGVDRRVHRTLVGILLHSNYVLVRTKLLRFLVLGLLHTPQVDKVRAHIDVTLGTTTLVRIHIGRGLIWVTSSESLSSVTTSKTSLVSTKAPLPTVPTLTS
jgi:hypothetical protein